MRKYMPALALAALLLTAALVGCGGKDADPAITTAPAVDETTIAGSDTDALAATESEAEATTDPAETTAEPSVEETTVGYFEATRIDRVEPDITKVPDAAVIGKGYDIFQMPDRGTGSYRYGATYLYNEDGSVDAYFASVGALGEWDWISYRHSPDNGVTWSDEKIVLTPTQGSMDFFSCCDPGVVYFNGYYYLAYTSTISNLMTCNNVFVARSKNPDGPFEKWNGSGWGGYDPQPIFYYDENYTSFGMGEPSFVELNGTLYIYYSNGAPSGSYTMVATADATDENWPATIQNHGVAVEKVTDSLDVKYVEEWGKFIAVGTADRITPNSWIGFFESNDGIHFEMIDIAREGTFAYLHNAGISSRRNGHIKLEEDADRLCVLYAYGQGWGAWNCRVQPISLQLSDGNDMVAERAKPCLPDTMELGKVLTDEEQYVTLVRPAKDVYTYPLSKGSFTLAINQFNAYYEKKVLGRNAEGLSFTVYDESVCTIDADSRRVTLVGVGTTAVELRYGDLVCLFHICVTEESNLNEAVPVELVPVRNAYTIYLGERSCYNPQIRTRLMRSDGSFTEYYVDDTADVLTYTGYDASVIRVDGKGIISAISAGETTVTVTFGDRSCPVKVVVSENPEDAFLKRETFKDLNFADVDLSQKGSEKVFSGVGSSVVCYDETQQALKATATNHDPILDMNFHNSVMPLTADDYHTLEITYMIPTETSDVANQMQIFLCAGDVTGANESCSVRFPLVKDGEYHTLTLDLTQLDYWTGYIHSVRIDYFNRITTGDTMYLKSIRLIEK